MSVDGYLMKRGYPVVIGEQDIDRTKAINLAIGNKNLLVDCFAGGSFMGYYNPYGVIDKRDYNYYFLCSPDYKSVSLTHIYDHGEGIEESECSISDNLRLAIIGKCMLSKQIGGKLNVTEK